jgi:hypothetical protein
MKTILRIVVLLIGLGPVVAAAQPSTPEDFIAAYRAALEQKDAGKLEALAYTNGMSDADKQMADTMAKMAVGMGGGEIADISLEPLPADFRLGGIANGKKFELTCPPAGLIKVQYKKVANGPLSTSAAYAVIDGHYFLVATKSTDLGWKGPPDQSLIVNAMCTSPDKIEIHAKWNVSGVEQEQTFHSGSAGVMGQYFESVTITCSDDNAQTTPTISEGGKEVFHGAALKGKGVVAYTKK